MVGEGENEREKEREREKDRERNRESKRNIEIYWDEDRDWKRNIDWKPWSSIKLFWFHMKQSTVISKHDHYRNCNQINSNKENKVQVNIHNGKEQC